jgi:hypothetical protein
MRDLATFRGIEDYVNSELREALELAIKAHRETPSVGVVIATWNGQQTYDEPQPALFGGFGVEEAQVRGMLTHNARKLRAKGVLYVEMEGRTVRVHLEHAEFGDRLWEAELVGATLGAFAKPEPVANEDVTRFLPRRYMN